ncbi:hypothetical protein AB6A40_001389 [Gnathostoma spinigerum]|uniref:Uncharacterized protein n=1 Tax=Gnathostoma spinigerum TaxID=75299 RepID=A0ABD6E525_9BILA
MKSNVMIALFAVLVLETCGWPTLSLLDDQGTISQRILENAYQNALLKMKRSPSMGLSLAEYMAAPQGQENFHFIPPGRT